jgi:hypothetical protein
LNRIPRRTDAPRFVIWLAGLMFWASACAAVADEQAAPATVANPNSTALTEVQTPTPCPDVPCYRVRRFEPYVTPDPRSCAPSFSEAIGSGLLPPFGWGWYGFGWPGYWGWGSAGWGFGGWGFGGWGSGGWGFRGWGAPWGAFGNYPYPFGFNGSFWFPRGSSWPYPSLSNWVYGGPRFLTPLSLPVYPLYPFASPYGPGPGAGAWTPRLGQYYW